MTGGPSTVINNIIDARDYPIGYLGAYAAFTQTYNTMLPPIEVFEPLLQ